MAKQSKRYRTMERYMTYALLTDTILFLLYLLFSGIGVIWMKVILSVLIALQSVLCLVFLYISKELLRPRSLWMSVGAAAILLCLLFSLILNFPSPNQYKKTSTADHPSGITAYCSEYL